MQSQKLNKLDEIINQIKVDERGKIEKKLRHGTDFLTDKLKKTVFGSLRNRVDWIPRFLISPFSPPLYVFDENEFREIRGQLAYLILGPPSTGKSLLESIVKTNGLNIVLSQVVTPGSIGGTSSEESGLARELTNSIWIIPEALIMMQNINVIGQVRSIIEEQSLSKSSAGELGTRHKVIQTKTALFISYVGYSNELQLLSRLITINLSDNIDDTKLVGKKLANSINIGRKKVKKKDESLPIKYFAIISDKLKDVKEVIIPEKLRKKLYKLWEKHLSLYEYSNVPVSVSKRDLLDGFRLLHNNCCLNIFSRRLKDGVLHADKKDFDCVKNELVDIMETRSSIRMKGDVKDPEQLAFYFYMLGQDPNLSFRDAEEKMGEKFKERAVTRGALNKWKKRYDVNCQLSTKGNGNIHLDQLTGYTKKGGDKKDGSDT